MSAPNPNPDPNQNAPTPALPPSREFEVVGPATVYAAVLETIMNMSMHRISRMTSSTFYVEPRDSDQASTSTSSTASNLDGAGNGSDPPNGSSSSSTMN